jgi:hypothetical protein
MERFFTISFSSLFLLLGIAISQDAKKRDPDLPIRTDAEEIIKEFKKDPAKAEKKYDPIPAKKGVLGTTITIGPNEVESVNPTEMTIRLLNSTDYKVVLIVDKLPEKGRFAATGTGTFKEFKDKTIVIKCDHIKYDVILDEKKK